jgi:hypothetical protein
VPCDIALKPFVLPGQKFADIIPFSPLTPHSEIARPSRQNILDLHLPELRIDNNFFLLHRPCPNCDECSEDHPSLHLQLPMWINSPRLLYPSLHVLHRSAIDSHGHEADFDLFVPIVFHIVAKIYFGGILAF